jgi:hypothetical protein
MAGYVAARPNGGYGAHAYRFEDHGLDRDAVRAKFRAYMLHFGIEAEEPGHPARAHPPLPVAAQGAAGGG